MTDVSDVIRVGNHLASGQGAFTNAAGAATDPTAVVLTVKQWGVPAVEYAWPTPTGVQLALVKEAGQTGRFYADVTILAAPKVFARLVGTGAVGAAAEYTIDVSYPRVGG